MQQQHKSSNITPDVEKVWCNEEKGLMEGASLEFALLDEATLTAADHNPLSIGPGALPTPPTPEPARTVSGQIRDPPVSSVTQQDSANPSTPEEPTTTASLLTSTATVPNQSKEQIPTPEIKRSKSGRKRALSPRSRAHAATIRQQGACAACRSRKIKACQSIYHSLSLPSDIY